MSGCLAPPDAVATLIALIAGHKLLPSPASCAGGHITWQGLPGEPAWGWPAAAAGADQWSATPLPPFPLGGGGYNRGWGACSGAMLKSGPQLHLVLYSTWHVAGADV